MGITIHLYYTGRDGSALRFAREMEASGAADQIRAEDGNLQYDYFLPLEGGETVLLIDRWESQAALDRHHASPMMRRIARMRETYDLHMRVERYAEAEDAGDDRRFIRD